MATLALAALTLVGGGAAAATTFTDPAGDSEGAPDITSVVVANDLAGVVTFTIAVANQPVLAADGELVLALDSDADEGTGDSGGFDYVFDLRGSDQSWSFGHWNGATYDFNVPATTLKIAYSAGVATIAVNRSELSNTRKLDFYVFSVQVDANEETLAQDDVPDGDGVLSYTLTLPKPVGLTAGKPVAVPAKPRAGAPVVVSVPIRRTDTGLALAGGVAACKATVGGRAVRATARIVRGRAQCVVRLRPGAKGKLLRGTLTVTYKTARIAKSFAFRVG